MTRYFEIRQFFFFFWYDFQLFVAKQYFRNNCRLFIPVYTCALLVIYFVLNSQLKLFQC